METSLFLEKISEKKDGNALETWLLGIDTAYNC